jgi:transposase
MPWSGEHRGFVVEAFFKHGESVTATQRAFRKRFGLRANESVPDWKTILLWVQRVRATGSALKRKPPGRPKNVRTPENITTVRASIELFPTRSARKLEEYWGRTQPRGLLVPAGWSYGPYSTSSARNFEGDVPG